MGDIEVQTAVEPVGDGRFTAMVHADWEIWGPCGGYVAALALRAAGAESPFARPASFFCHYLSVAAFAPVDLVVTPLRAGRTVLAQRVTMTQEDRPSPGGHGLVRRRRGRVWSTRTSTHRRCPIPRSCRRGRTSGRTRAGPPCPSGTTSTSAWSSGRSQWPPSDAPAADLADLGAQPAHGDLRRPVGRCGALAHRPRRGELAGRVAPAPVSRSRPTSRPAWISTPRSSTPA